MWNDIKLSVELCFFYFSLFLFFIFYFFFLQGLFFFSFISFDILYNKNIWKMVNTREWNAKECIQSDKVASFFVKSTYKSVLGHDYTWDECVIYNSMKKSKSQLNITNISSQTIPRFYNFPLSVSPKPLPFLSSLFSKLHRFPTFRFCPKQTSNLSNFKSFSVMFFRGGILITKSLQIQWNTFGHVACKSCSLPRARLCMLHLCCDHFANKIWHMPE